jgi:cation diffusion facilitator family transporter
VPTDAAPPTKPQKDEGGQRVVIAALLINVAIAGFKFVAAGFSRSTAMLAEACHSLADTANQIFLLLGLRLSARPPDEKHPFGYGPETYFWAFMVALCIFSVGGAFSVYEGIQKVVHSGEPGHELRDPRWAYAVLGASILLESYSFTVAMREFKHLRRGRGLRATLHEARDPTVLTVLFEDLAALFGLGVAGVGIILAQMTGKPAWDGAASVVVGLALVAVAVVLARDAKSLLIGQSVPEGERNQIRSIAAAGRDVVAVVHIRTIHLGPKDVMCGLKLTFNPTIDIRTLEVRINELEAQLRAALPHLTRIYVEPGFDEHAVRREAV